MQRDSSGTEKRDTAGATSEKLQTLEEFLAVPSPILVSRELPLSSQGSCRIRSRQSLKGNPLVLCPPPRTQAGSIIATKSTVTCVPHLADISERAVLHKREDNLQEDRQKDGHGDMQLLLYNVAETPPVSSTSMTMQIDLAPSEEVRWDGSDNTLFSYEWHYEKNYLGHTEDASDEWVLVPRGVMH
jgi:hypothetical protein